MTVTVTKKITLKQAKNEERNEKDLFWINSLRQFIPPVGSKSRWLNLSSEACKLYLLIWALDSAKWTPKKNTPYKGVHYSGLTKFSGYDYETLREAKKQLVKRKFVRVDMEIINDTPELWYNLIYDPPVDILENGVEGVFGNRMQLIANYL